MLAIEPVLKTRSTTAAIQHTVVTAPLAYGMDSNRTKPTTSHRATTKPQAHNRSRAYIASMRLDKSDPEAFRPKLSDVMYNLPATRAPMVPRFQRPACCFFAAPHPVRQHPWNWRVFTQRNFSFLLGYARPSAPATGKLPEPHRLALDAPTTRASDNMTIANSCYPITPVGLTSVSAARNNGADHALDFRVDVRVSDAASVANSRTG